MWKYYNPIDQLIWYVFVAVAFIGAAIWWNIGNWLDSHPAAGTLIMAGIIIVFWVLPICVGILKIVSTSHVPKIYNAASYKEKEAALLKSDPFLEEFIPALQNLESALQLGPIPAPDEITLKTDEAIAFLLDKERERDFYDEETDELWDKSVYNAWFACPEERVKFFETCFDKCINEHPELLMAKYKDSIKFAFDLLVADRRASEDNLDAEDGEERVAQLSQRYYDIRLDFLEYHQKTHKRLEYKPKNQEHTIKDYTKIFDYIKEVKEKLLVVNRCKDAAMVLESLSFDKAGESSHWRA